MTIACLFMGHKLLVWKSTPEWVCTRCGKTLKEIRGDRNGKTN